MGILLSFLIFRITYDSASVVQLVRVVMSSCPG